MHDLAEAEGEVADHVYPTRRSRAPAATGASACGVSESAVRLVEAPLIVTSSRIAPSGSCASLSGVRSRPMISSGQGKRRPRRSRRASGKA